MTMQPLDPPADQGPPPLFDRFIRRGALIILIFFGGFLGWATVAPLDEGVVTSGQVAVDSRRKTVQHLEGGIIGRLHVREGDLVEAGAVLISLDTTQARSRRDQTRARLLNTIARLDRLHSERLDETEIAFSDAVSDTSEPLIAEARAVQENFFDARMSQITGQISVLEQRIAQLGDQINGLDAQRSSAETQAELVQDEIERYNQLSELQLIDVRNRLARERELARLTGEIGRINAEVARAQVAIGEAEIEILQVERSFKESVASDLIEAQELALSLRDELIALEDVLTRTEIIAPQSGQVLNLAFSTIGGVIPPGEPIMDIVPLGDALVVEAQVRPMDIDNVVTGLAVRARISAFTSNTMPEMNGVVITVGADALVDQASGLTFYPVRIGFDDSEFEKLEGQDVRPGMPVEVFIQGGTRTPLDYFLKPITSVLRRALREG